MDDPVLGWLIPRDARLRARLERFFGLELREYALSHGRVWTTDARAGAALAMPPGTWRLPLTAQLLQGLGFGSDPALPSGR